jgi:hypothetical protein
MYSALYAPELTDRGLFGVETPGSNPETYLLFRVARELGIAQVEWRHRIAMD